MTDTPTLLRQVLERAVRDIRLEAKLAGATVDAGCFRKWPSCSEMRLQVTVRFPKPKREMRQCQHEAMPDCPWCPLPKPKREGT